MDNLENNKRLNITMNFSLEPNEHQIKLSSKTDFFHDELTESEAKLLFANVVKLFIDTVKSDRINMLMKTLMRKIFAMNCLNLQRLF